jgi:cystathionine gamma-synthase
MEYQTKLALSGQQVDRCYHSIVPPIYQTAIFKFEDIGKTGGFDYTRSGNPTRKALEDVLADLDGGAGAVATTSGMGAISTVLATLEVGAHVICSHDCYGGTERLLTKLSAQGKLSVSYVDLTDPRHLTDAIQQKSRVLWIETPSNPLLRIVDIKSVARIAKESGLLVVVDNTFLSPLLQRPIELGADYVVYSTTKYINGHSDVVGGAIVAATETLNTEIQFTANAHGTIAQPFDCWLVLRGLKTLPLRIRQHEINAHSVADALQLHPAVRRVFYPGLSHHEGHSVAAQQQNGFGGMVSFEVDGCVEDVFTILRSTRVFALAESLGGVESLIEHPATMSHASMRPEQRADAGITDGVIRLSVGIEDPSDLVADLYQALDKVIAFVNDDRTAVIRHNPVGDAVDVRDVTHDATASRDLLRDAVPLAVRV